MSTDITAPQSSAVAPLLDWAAPEPPTGLVYEDGEPLETPRHRIAMNLLICSVQQALRDRPDFYAGGNMTRSANGLTRSANGQIEQNRRKPSC